MTETCAGVWADRHMPVAMLAEQCKAYEASGVVDGVLIPDQLANFIPQQLWTAENSPLAAMMGDPDSMCDGFMIGPYVAAHAPGLHLHMTTDSVRRAPAELVQSMLTLACITDGKATFQIGGGERKQTAPFGHPTNQGMSRMKDLFRIFERFMESDGPFDFEGRRWTFKDAYLGGARPHRPQLWGLGAGPMLLDYSTSWADGIAVAVPMAWSSPEMVAQEIATVRAQLAEKGRDPDAFRIGIWACALMHDDAAALAAAIENPILKWVIGALGRVETRTWKDIGLELPFPDGWTYYKDLAPYSMDTEFVESIVAAVTPAHARAGFMYGSPAEIAAQVQPYVDAGVDYVCVFDYLPVVSDPAEAPDAVRRMVELCGLIRAM